MGGGEGMFMPVCLPYPYTPLSLDNAYCGHISNDGCRTSCSHCLQGIAWTGRGDIGPTVTAITQKKKREKRKLQEAQKQNLVLLLVKQIRPQPLTDLPKRGFACQPWVDWLLHGLLFPIAAEV